MTQVEEQTRNDYHQKLEKSDERQRTKAEKYSAQLDDAENFGDIFDVVKRSVEESVGIRRAGLMLYLTELPMYLGAFHEVGGNAIVMNRALLEQVQKSAASVRDANSFVYSILLHEYLHSLGYIDEAKARKAAHDISEETFGTEHPATRMAYNPMGYFPWIQLSRTADVGRTTTVVKDFDRTVQRYIV